MFVINIQSIHDARSEKHEAKLSAELGTFWTDFFLTAPFVNIYMTRIKEYVVKKINYIGENKRITC